MSKVTTLLPICKKSYKPLVHIALILNLTSCQLFIEPLPKGWDWDKRVLSGVRGFPSTDTEYGKGFKDGCYAVWDAVSKGYLSDAVKSKYDYKRGQKNPDYDTGWWDGLEQCNYIMDWDIA